MIPHNRPTLGEQEEAAAARVIRSGWLAQGKEVQAFETELCEFLGLPEGHAVAVSSGSAALFLALWAVGAESKRVAIPAFSCASLKHAVTFAKGRAVFMDTDGKGPNADLAVHESEIAVRAHIFGAVNSSQARGASVIEDCAQAIGAEYPDGTRVGTQGSAGVFSFYATKLITSGGQGGMVVSRDSALIERIRDYREFDREEDGKTRFNFQMSDLEAAIGREQLRKLPSFLRRREEIFERYLSAGLPILCAPRGSIRQRAVLRCAHPRDVIAKLSEQGIRAIVPITNEEILAPAEACPNAHALARSSVSLPIYPSLTDAEVEKIVGAVTRIIEL